jgi:excisionase family DNA binding protein
MSNKCAKSDEPSVASVIASAPRRLIDVQAAASYLAVSVPTLYGWVWQRRIPFVKVGRALRFDVADLDSFVAAHKTSARRNPRTSAEHAA